MTHNKLSITMIKSKHGRLPVHQDCLRGLGLRKINQTVEVEGTPEILGMVKKIEYMLKVKEL